MKNDRYRGFWTEIPFLNQRTEHKLKNIKGDNLCLKIVVFMFFSQKGSQIENQKIPKL